MDSISVKDQDRLDQLHHGMEQSLRIANNMSEYRLSAEKDVDKFFDFIETLIDQGVE